jgi:hypothetical protein
MPQHKHTVEGAAATLREAVSKLGPRPAARLIGIPHSTLQRFLEPKSNVLTAQLDRIARGLGFEVRIRRHSGAPGQPTAAQTPTGKKARKPASRRKWVRTAV